MGNQLHIKLLMPTAIVGVLAILIALIFVDHLSATGLVTFLVATLAIQLVAGFVFFTQQISQRVDKLNAYMDQVISPETAPSTALKDQSSDELASLTNKLGGFVESLADVVADIRRESEHLRQGAGSLTSQISDSVMAVDQSSEQISQMAASIDEVASTSGALSQSASEVSETANQVLDLLSQGRASSDNSQKTIENFAQEVTGMANDLALLQEECARIGTVLDVIRGIADQTNLLALNAAIEAARAGEQGRGFAVVADEVRALAHRTQESTVEIQSMVEGLQDKSDNAVNAITKGQALTQDSLEQSEKVVDALTQIGQVFTEVNSLTTQIASGTQEQQQATASMNDNMAAVVSLSEDINQGLNKVAEHAELQKATSEEVDTTLNRVCV